MITPKGAKSVINRRKAYQPKPIELDSSFPQQNAFVEDSARYIDAQCSRRAGKTNGLAIRFLKTMERHPKSQCVYLAMTFDSAKQIMMPAIQEQEDKYKIGLTFTDSRIKHPNGSVLHLMGADQKNFTKRLKGRKFPGVAIDEAQDFGAHLQSLIDDVLTPSISDYADGWLALTGTPGPVPQGYFFQVTQERKYGYSHHAWTILDNPYMPEPKAFIADLKAKRQWPDDHPTLQREWLNKWVLDVESLWVRYQASVNHYTELPEGKYTYALGIDIGFNDADALAVVAWSEDSPTTYLVEELITRKQGLTGLVEQVQAMRKKYDISKMVIDEGGLGKKLAEEMRRRHSIPVHPADKSRKQESVELMNDALRLGKLKAKSSSQFALDSYLIQIDWDKSTPNRIVIKKKPHSDVIDAVLYIFRESPAYAYEKPVVKPKFGTKEYADAQEDSMWEAANSHFSEQAALERYNKGEE